MKIINHVIEMKTAATLDFIDITDKVQEVLGRIKAANGVINIQSLHTTMAIIVNEAEPLLITDIKKMLETIAPHTAEYMHDNFEIRTVNMCDGECQNGHSHCKAVHLPTSQFLNVVESKLHLGRWQRIFAIELDRARPRQISLQFIGE